MILSDWTNRLERRGVSPEVMTLIELVVPALAKGGATAAAVDLGTRAHRRPRTRGMLRYEDPHEAVGHAARAARELHPGLAWSGAEPRVALDEQRLWYWQGVGTCRAAHPARVHGAGGSSDETQIPGFEGVAGQLVVLYAIGDDGLNWAAVAELKSKADTRWTEPVWERRFGDEGVDAGLTPSRPPKTPAPVVPVPARKRGAREAGDAQ